MTKVRRAALASSNVLELSLDAKAVVKVGEFSRYGVSRVRVSALDHDHGAEAKVTPYGIFLPVHGELTIYIATSAVTSDFMVDRLQDWWMANRDRFPKVDTLLLLQDNGPENQSRRRQYLKRMVDFAQRHCLCIQLAYYPPYHSKYNPIERCWGVLEQHWDGTVLDTIGTVVRYAETMTWKGRRPIVHLVTTTYAKGVTLTNKEMAAVEACVTRMPGLERWFVNISVARNFP
jgi:Rhodopirellula transposase DDE domain